MKANEFLKKHGLNKAKVLLSTQGKTIANLKSEFTADQLKEYQGYIVSDDLMSFVELKRLVESYELINSLGGLEQAKYYAIDANACGAFDDENKIKQAIIDVESCQ